MEPAQIGDKDKSTQIKTAPRSRQDRLGDHRADALDFVSMVVIFFVVSLPPQVPKCR
jgi:hypothetical protein